MMSNKDLKDLISRNGIDLIDLESNLYNTLLLGVFEAICLKMKDPLIKQNVLSSFHKFSNHIDLVKQLSLEFAGCLLIDEESELLLKWLIAYFRRDGKRRAYSKAYKLNLLANQNYRCKICGKQISYEDSELDHIIPWDFVGDELQNNLQMLCNTCNERKGSSINFHLRMLLIKNTNFKKVI